MTEASKKTQKNMLKKIKINLMNINREKQKRNIIMMTNIYIKRKKPI